MKNTERQNVAEIIQSKFLDAIATSKKLPWQKPWQAMRARNIISMKPYKGINVLMLSMAGKDDYYLTYRQASANGGHVKKGCKSIPIVFYNIKTKTDANGQPILKDGKPDKMFTLRYYNVFNLSDCEANDSQEDKKKWGKLLERAKPLTGNLEFVPDEMAEKLIGASGIP